MKFNIRMYISVDLETYLNLANLYTLTRNIEKNSSEDIKIFFRTESGEML
jgi:ribosome maturation protein Sdo1